MHKIGVLAHYSEMEKNFMHMQGTEDCQLIFRMGVLDLAIETAKILVEAEHVEAIIANSKTADIIRPHISVPVIPLYLKTYNLLHAFYRAKKVGANLAFVEYANDSLQSPSVYDLDLVKEILGIDINHYQFPALSQTSETLENMLRDNCDTIVSSASCMIGKASRAGMNTFLVQEEENDMHEAIVSALNILKAKEKDAEQRNWLTSVINNSDSGYIILDSTGEVNLTNSRALEMLDIPLQKLEGAQFKNLAQTYPVIEKMLHCSQKISLVKHLGQELLVQCVPVQSPNSSLMGTMYTLNKLKNIQDAELQARRLILKKGFVAKYQFNDIIGSCSLIRATVAKAQKYAKTDAPVLICGESGTGKELFAQSIHNFSSRAHAPFLAINCATLPPQLLEAELFGYEGGAFTDAKKEGKAGLLEIANGGTVFLDEIGEMSLPLQARLLRALQEKEIRRVGGDSNISINVRIISATHRNLREACAEKQFRQDLYYRLNILPLDIPPLRARKDDIPVLVQFYLKKLSANYALPFNMPTACISKLSEYSWPGNIRELFAFIERLAILSDSGKISSEEFWAAFLELKNGPVSDSVSEICDENTVSIPIGSFQQMNNDIVRVLLERFNGDRKAVEQTLNISSTTLWRKLKESGTPG